MQLPRGTRYAPRRRFLRKCDRGRHQMKRHALFFSTFTAVMLALPAFAADGASRLMEVRGGKNAVNFEGMPSGPPPLRNFSRPPNRKAHNRPPFRHYRNPIPTPPTA